MEHDLMDASRYAAAPAFLGQRLVAIVRADSSAHLGEVVATLVASGLRAIELPLTTPGALEALAELVVDHGDDAMLGVGTVLDARAAEESIEAGARFLVGPSFSPDAMEVGRRHGVPVVPGAFTATEAIACWQLGAAAVKLFPASVGGPAYLRALRAPLPQIPFVPTGGIDLDDVAGYLRAGAAAVGLGAPLIGDAAAGGSLAALAERAVALVGIARDASAAAT